MKKKSSAPRHVITQANTALKKKMVHCNARLASVNALKRIVRNHPEYKRPSVFSFLFSFRQQDLKANILRPEEISSSMDDDGSHACAQGKFGARNQSSGR